MNWPEMSAPELIFWIVALVAIVIGFCRLAYQEGK
jgi:uncharacterized membrane protein YtjA (UPF0391 family)